jgi:hypothetical protein
MLLLMHHIVLQDHKRVRTAGRQVLADDGDVQLQDSRSQDYISWEALHRCVVCLVSRYSTAVMQCMRMLGYLGSCEAYRHMQAVVNAFNADQLHRSSTEAYVCEQPQLRQPQSSGACIMIRSCCHSSWLVCSLSR